MEISHARGSGPITGMMLDEVPVREPGSMPDSSLHRAHRLRVTRKLSVTGLVVHIATLEHGQEPGTGTMRALATVFPGHSAQLQDRSSDT